MPTTVKDGTIGLNEDMIPLSQQTGPHPSLLHLETEEDLQQDQLNFLRNSASEQSHRLPGSHTELFVPPDDGDPETPTSAQLPPIKERKIRPRRRRTLIQSKSSFPPVPLVNERSSVFARRSADSHNEDGNSSLLPSSHCSPPSNGSPSTSSSVQMNPDPVFSYDSRSAIASMTAEDIRAAQLEILESCKPESLRFLRERWQQRKLGPFSNSFVHGTAVPNSPSEETLPAASSANDSSINEKRGDSTVSSHFAGLGMPATERASNGEQESPVKDTGIAADDLSHYSTEVRGNDHMSISQLSNVRDSLLVPKTPVSETEAEKMLWMSEASNAVPSDSELDELLKATVDAIGPIAQERFDFDGRILSQDEIHSLPTHLGLHHHGTSPESAGYTLSEILTLMRSTAVPQRIVALRLLSSLVRLHGADVLYPLVRSGALALAFAPFPSPRAFHEARTNQMAYVDAIDALTHLHRPPFSTSVVPDIFFASRFYSPVDLYDTAVPVFDSLGQTDCVITLTRIAYANSVISEGIATVELALDLVRQLVIRCDGACRHLLNDKHAVAILKNLCTKSAEDSAKISMLACDVVAHIIVMLGWINDDFEKVEESFLDDSFLRNLGTQVAVVMRDGDKPLAAAVVLRATGSIRVMRAALTFQRGVVAFSVVAQATSRLLYENASSAVEAFLALEAYVHALHDSIAIREQASTSDGGNSARSELKGTGDVNDPFVLDQVSALVPVALAAVNRLVGNSLEDTDSVKAAGGHFAATLFLLYRIPFEASLLALIFTMCSNTSRAIVDVVVDNEADLSFVQNMASMCHSGARLLTRVKMDAAYVQRELDILLKVALNERVYANRFEGVPPWRPVANACTEWLGLLGSANCNSACVEQALVLLPLLSDVPVVLDLLSRCVVRVEALQAMDDSISVEMAQKCASELLPAAYDGLNSSPKAELWTLSKDVDESDGLAPVRLSLLNVMELWLKKSECLPSFMVACSAFLKAMVVSPAAIFHVLLLTPPSLYEDLESDYFKIMFDAGSAAVSQHGRLIARKEDTVVSTVSTTPDSVLTESVCQLADRLLSNGPQMDCDEDGNFRRNTLASMVLSLMCRSDADTSLRIKLWKKTVADCGGATLFVGAEFLGPETDQQFLEDEEVVGEYVSAFAFGYLDEKRCPSVLGDIIISRLGQAIVDNPHSNALHLLTQVIEQNRGSKAYKSLSSIVKCCSCRKEVEIVSDWLKSQVQ